MHPDPFLVSAIHWEVNIGFIVTVLFPLAVRLVWPWNKTSWGWNIVSLDICIAVTLLPDVLFLDFGIDSDVLEWFQVAALGAVIVNVLWRAALIFRTQRDGAREDHDVASRSRSGTPSAGT